MAEFFSKSFVEFGCDFRYIFLGCLQGSAKVLLDFTPFLRFKGALEGTQTLITPDSGFIQQALLSF
jgi:hypothetical protein